MTNLTEYLNSKYIKDDGFGKEVFKVTKTLYDPVVKEEGIKEGIKEGIYKVARRLLDKGLNVEMVADMTELSIEDVERLK